MELISSFVKSNNVSMVVVGPEQPLVEGIVDKFKFNGIPCFGPSKNASRIEGSKAFSKSFMKRHNIPTPKFHIFEDYIEAKKYISLLDYPVVLKASGLASGKGVILPSTSEETLEELYKLMVMKPFGNSCNEIIIEERVYGPEISFLAFTDGYTVIPMPVVQDYKRLFDNDKGPNTGGMGSFCPSPLVNPYLIEEIMKRIINPTICGLRKEGNPYIGVIYAGILLSEEKGIQCLEFNCRFGDPESQVLIPLLDCDLLDILEACVEIRLDSIKIKWKNLSSITTVACSSGYPFYYEIGKEIYGLSEFIEEKNSIKIFHSGTQILKDGRIITSGGRVLSVTSIGKNLLNCRNIVYKCLESIIFDGIFFRKDIGEKIKEHKEKNLTYKDSGVNIISGNSFINIIKPLVKETARKGSEANLGGFGGLFDLKEIGFEDPILVSGTDGVGTKLLIAQDLEKHDTIGIDLVAMSVNDILVQGAEPLFFLDYFATGSLSIIQAKSVLSGIIKACIECNCALIGGETAEMPGMYSYGRYDLAGFAVGAVERNKVLPSKLNEGDIVIGLGSSGIHSNGFSLVRLLIENIGLEYNDLAPFDKSKTLAEVLLTPTKLYVKSCLPLIKKGYIKAMAHITGGGLIENIPRILNQNQAVLIDLSSWSLPPLFKWISEQGNICQDELIRTFNCGIGMVIITGSEFSNQVLKELSQTGESVYQIGKVILKTDCSVMFENSW